MSYFLLLDNLRKSIFFTSFLHDFGPELATIERVNQNLTFLNFIILNNIKFGNRKVSHSKLFICLFKYTFKKESLLIMFNTICIFRYI